jgi:hypothetical protein
MKVYLSNDLKIFITSNLDINNNVNVTGFTSANTQELIVQSGSLNIDVEKTYEYVEGSQLIASDRMLESFAKSNVSIGALSLSTYLNSSSTGPFDARLWNALSNESSYPGSKWTLGSTDVSMKLIRDTTALDAFGIIVISNDTAYVLNATRLESCSVNYNISDLVSCSWSAKFQELVVLKNISFTESDSQYSFTSGLIGSAKKVVLSDYTFSPAKVMLVNVMNVDGVSLGNLAATELSVNISNSLNYLEDMHIDKEKLGYTFTGAGTFSISGSLSFYARSAGSYSSTLVQELTDTNNNPYLNKVYGLSIQLPYTQNKKLSDIVLGYCNVSVKTGFSDVLTNTLNFKVANSNYNNNCFIKFYT